MCAITATSTCASIHASDSGMTRCSRCIVCTYRAVSIVSTHVAINAQSCDGGRCITSDTPGNEGLRWQYGLSDLRNFAPVLSGRRETPAQSFGSHLSFCCSVSGQIGNDRQIADMLIDSSCAYLCMLGSHTISCIMLPYIFCASLVCGPIWPFCLQMLVDK